MVYYESFHNSMKKGPKKMVHNYLYWQTKEEIVAVVAVVEVVVKLVGSLSGGLCL